MCCHGEICSEEATGKTGGKMESSYCMLNDAFMMYSAQANAKIPGVHPLVTNYTSNGALNALTSAKGKFCLFFLCLFEFHESKCINI